MKNYELLVSILKDQVTPALGCTEPGAVAYAVAKARELLNEDVNHLDILVDKNILKNGMGVGIPGTNEKGIIVAAALALVSGKSEYKLQALKDVKGDQVAEAFKIIDNGIIKLGLKEDADGLYIEINAKGKNNTSQVIIKKSHTNIDYMSVNGKEINTHSVKKLEDKNKSCSNLQFRDRIREFTIKDIVDFVQNVDYDKIQFINEGIVMNKKMGEIGLNQKLGLGFGSLIDKKQESTNDLERHAKAITAAASDARMSGYPLPVMSSAGSGNHGLVSILPIAILGEGRGIEHEKIVRAITLSHLVTIFVKSYIGSLSPVCGCAVAAGVGASAGLTNLFGGNIEQVEGAIKNMIAGVSGMICDGAKLGCAYKLSISVSAALEATDMALNNIFIPSDNGILNDTAEKTIQNLGKVSNEGMNNTDNIILKVMLDKCS